jgi:hypothetical protein
MKILPFMDIPVMEIDTPLGMTRRIDLAVWADADIVKFSAAFVCYAEEGKSQDDYVYQVGFPHQNCLVTTKEVIEEMGDLAHEARESKLVEYLELLPKIRAHMNLYFEKINSIPVWGTMHFKALRVEGKTVRILEGPHKGGRLKKEQRRQVILDERGDIVYGPIVKRTKL